VASSLLYVLPLPSGKLQHGNTSNVKKQGAMTHPKLITSQQLNQKMLKWLKFQRRQNFKK
jgi:hypothetical protein